MSTASSFSAKLRGEVATAAAAGEEENAAATAVAVSPTPAAADTARAWSAAEWLSSLDIGKVAVAEALLKDAEAGRSELESIRAIGHTTLDEGALVARLAQAGVLEAIAATLLPRLRELTETATRKGDEALQAKFAEGAAFTLRYSGLSTFFGGLEGKIGAPDPKVEEAMVHEHCEEADSLDEFTTSNYQLLTTPLQEYVFVAKPDSRADWPLECREDGWDDVRKRRRPLLLAEFQARVDEVNARLEKLGEPMLLLLEAIGGRLYTGPMFVKYNDLLRGFGPALAGCKGNGYRTTIHVINSCIVKSSKITCAHKVYRGMAGGALPPEFWTPNEYNVRGGIEAAFLSTTLDRQVAFDYASRPGQPGVVFEMQMGMIDRGAEFQWLSQYPHEAEICFAPLTGIEVQRIRVQGAVLVLEARLSVNLLALTIEQVVSKRRKVVYDMCANMEGELAAEIMAGKEWAALQALMAASGVDDIAAAAQRALRAKLKRITAQPAEYFNSDTQLSGAVKAAVDGKAAISSWPKQLPSRVGGGQIEGPVAAKRSLEEFKAEVTHMRETSFASPPTAVEASGNARAWLAATREALAKLRAREAEINLLVEAYGFEVPEQPQLELSEKELGLYEGAWTLHDEWHTFMTGLPDDVPLSPADVVTTETAATQFYKRLDESHELKGLDGLDMPLLVSLAARVKGLKEIMPSLSDSFESARTARAQVEGAERMAKTLEEHQAATEMDLEGAQPAIVAAAAALKTVSKKAISELKGLSNPPAGCVEVVRCVMLLMGEVASNCKVDWSVAKKFLGDSGFIAKIQSFDKDRITDEVRAAAKKLMDLECFDVEIMSKRSVAASGLCAWCFAIEKYCVVMVLVKPKLKALADTKKKVAAEEAKVATAHAESAMVHARVQELQTSSGLGEAERELVGRFLACCL